MANRLRQTVQSIEGTPAEQIAGKASKDIDMRAGLDNLAGFISNTYNSMSNLDKAALFTAPFPVLGDIVGFAADTKTFIEDPTLTNAGLGIAGLLPFVPSGTLMRAAKKGYGGVKEGVKSSAQKAIDNIFSRKPDAIGNTEAATDTFSSIPIPMTPKRYASLVPEEKLNPENIKFLTKKLEEGKDIAPPQMTLQWNGKKFVPTGGQEGRHRMKAVENLYGDKEVPVTVKLLNEKGNKIPVEELQGTRKFYTVKDSEEAEAMLQSLNEFKKISDKAVDFVEKKFPKMRESWWLDDLNTKDTVTLYHGTNVKNLKRIKEEGLTPDASNKTFLSPDPDTGIGYASMTGGEKTFRQIGKKAKHNPMENRVLLEIEVPKDIIFKNINDQKSNYSISKLLDPKAKDNFKPYDKKENLPYYAKTEFSIEGGVPPEFIKSISTKPDSRLKNKKTTAKKKQGGSVVERNPYANYQLKAI